MRGLWAKVQRSSATLKRARLVALETALRNEQGGVGLTGVCSHRDCSPPWSWH